ncbi:MAG: hypothetical protein ACYDCX_00005, partial [Acidithiobacillus sp.]
QSAPPLNPPDPQHWEKLTAKVLKAYQQHGTISTTSKALNLTYYTTQVILREEQTRQNQAKRQALKDHAQALQVQGASIEDIAREVERSAKTVRRWLRETRTPSLPQP